LATSGDYMAMGWSVSSRVSVHVGVVSQLEDGVLVTEAECAAGVGMVTATTNTEANTAAMTSARIHMARTDTFTREILRVRCTGTIWSG
jgi:hypothetical protein